MSADFYISNRLFLAARGAQPGAWLPLGCLAHDDEGYYFTMTQAAKEKSDDWKVSLFGIPKDPKWHFNHVPPPFHMRVWNRGRKDRPNYLRWLGLSEEEANDPMVEMAHSFGRKVLDEYETFAEPKEQNGHYDFCFPLQDTTKLIWGDNCKAPANWRELYNTITAAIRNMPEGEEFRLEKNGDKKVALLTPDGEKVGFCPRAYAPEIQTLMDNGESNLKVIMERVNDASPDMMAICRLTCRAPKGFAGFCQSEEYKLVR